MNIVYISLDSISYNDSWIKNKKVMPFLFEEKKNWLNFHNHYSVTNNTIGNIFTILSGIYPLHHGFIGKTHKFSNNKYGYLQEKLKKLGFQTHFISTSRINHKRNQKNKFRFDQIDILSPSSANYHVHAENVHRFLKLKFKNKKKENNFFMIHFDDAHEPYQTPFNKISKNKSPNIWKFLYSKKNIFYYIPRRFARKYIKPSTIIKNYQTYKDYRYLKSLKPDPLGPLLCAERYNNFYENCWSNKKFLIEYIEQKNDAIRYLDKQLSSFFKFIKKNEFSKNTIFFMSSDHGANGPINPNHIEKNGYLNEITTHIPLSVFSFDNNLIKKYKLKSNKSQMTSHIDIYETILSLFTKIKKNLYSENLLKLKNKNRYILSEISQKRLKFGQIIMRKKNKNINFRVIPTDNFNLIQQCPRKFIVGDITENEHREYLNFKKQYINTINKDRLV